MVVYMEIINSQFPAEISVISELSTDSARISRLIGADAVIQNWFREIWRSYGKFNEQNRFCQACNHEPAFILLCNLLTCVVPGDGQEKPTHGKTTSFYLPTIQTGCELDMKISVLLDSHWKYCGVGICDSNDVHAVDKLKPKRYWNSLLAVVEVFDATVVELSWNKK